MENISQPKQHLECIFDSITDPIFSISSQYKVTRINKSFLTKVRKSFTEILGQVCYTQLYQRSSRCPECPLEAVLNDSQRHSMKLELESGTIYQVDCFPLKEKNNKIVAMVEVVKDITEAENIRRELGELQEQTLEKSMLLANKNDELARAYVKISQELKLAQLVQRGIMPQTLPQVPEINTAVFYLPMEEVGGDLYDFIHINPDLLGVILVDVSGHGIPAAFIAAMAKMSFYLHANNSQSSARVLSQVNQDMCDNLHTDEYFFTTTFCLIDLITNRIKYSNAGHPPLLILRKDQKSLEEVQEKSIIMGLNADAKYYETEIQLKKGDRLIFYTDGIFESIHHDKNYGFNRFCDTLLESASYTVNQQIEKVKDELNQMLEKESPSDDITLVIMEILIDSKFEYFQLAEQFSSQEKVTILAVRHPLEFDKIISSVLHKMDNFFYHDQAIRATKFAIYEALNLYYHTGKKSGEPVYFAFSCTKKKCTMVIVDSRSLAVEPLEAYHEQPQSQGALEILNQNVDRVYFIDGGKKILLEKFNT